MRTDPDGPRSGPYFYYFYYFHFDDRAGPLPGKSCPVWLHVVSLASFRQRSQGPIIRPLPLEHSTLSAGKCRGYSGHNAS